MRPQIYEALSMLDDKVKLRVFPKSRNVQEPTGSPARGSTGKHPDNMFKVITYPETNLRTLNLMDQYIKKLTSQITDAGCHVIADIVKVNETIVELDLPKNMKILQEVQDRD